MNCWSVTKLSVTSKHWELFWVFKKKKKPTLLFPRLTNISLGCQDKMRLRHWSAALGAKLPNRRPSIPSICSGTTSASCWRITKLFSLNDSLRSRLFSFMRAWQFDRCYVTDSCWDSRRLQKSVSRFWFCPYWRKKKKPNRWINSPKFSKTGVEKFLLNFKVCWRE